MHFFPRNGKLRFCSSSQLYWSWTAQILTQGRLFYALCSCLYPGSPYSQINARSYNSFLKRTSRLWLFRGSSEMPGVLTVYQDVRGSHTVNVNHVLFRSLRTMRGGATVTHLESFLSWSREPRPMMMINLLSKFLNFCLCVCASWCVWVVCCQRWGRPSSQKESFQIGTAFQTCGDGREMCRLGTFWNDSQTLCDALISK